MAMSYNEYLRKNPTDYKARAMGRKRWEATQGAKQKMKVGTDGKVRISTKDDPKKYPSYSEQARGESKKSTGGRGKDTQVTQYDKIRQKGQKGTPSGEKAKESKSAGQNNKPQTAKDLALIYGTGITLAALSKMTAAEKKKLITDQRKRLAITDRSKTMNVDKEGNVRQGSNEQPKPKESKKEKAKKVAKKIKDKAKTAGKTVLSKAKSAGKFGKTLLKGGLKRVPLVGNLMAKKAGASSLEDLSVAQLKKMGMSDAQIKKLKGQ
tara:strand:+ start:45 stop:839 length:795 start_codon:yes stop_codon:yes gene_type:complete